jgi:hypothetical protein
MLRWGGCSPWRASSVVARTFPVRRWTWKQLPLPLGEGPAEGRGRGNVAAVGVYLPADGKAQALAVKLNAIRITPHERCSIASCAVPVYP